MDKFSDFELCTAHSIFTKHLNISQEHIWSVTTIFIKLRMSILVTITIILGLWHLNHWQCMFWGSISLAIASCYRYVIWTIDNDLIIKEHNELIKILGLLGSSLVVYYLRSPSDCSYLVIDLVTNEVYLEVIRNPYYYSCSADTLFGRFLTNYWADFQSVFRYLIRTSGRSSDSTIQWPWPLTLTCIRSRSLGTFWPLAHLLLGRSSPNFYTR